MRLSRRIFVIAVLLTSGLMAASEVPEILTLTDNVSNDYVLRSQRLPGCSLQDVTQNATTSAGSQFAASLQDVLPGLFSSTTQLEQTSSLPLSMLGVQRK